MNLRELRAAVRNRNGIPDPGDGLAGLEDINSAVAQALSDIGSEDRWPWLLTSSSLTFTNGAASLPSDCTTIHKLVVNGDVATRVSLDAFLDDMSGCVWTDVGAQIKLTPVPTTAPTATLYYYRAEPAFTSDTSTPLLPVQWHQLLVARASYHLNVRRQMNDHVARDVREWDEGVKNMRRAAWASLGPRRIRSGFRPVQPARWS